jgi:hypothetical protein
MARSSYAKRKGTGRKTRHQKIVKTKVVHHRHRRYAGVRGAVKGTSARNRRKALAKVAQRRRRFFGRKKSTHPRAARGQGLKRTRKPLGRHGHRVFKGRRKSAHKRHMRKGLHRRFLGRKKLTHKRAYHGRHVKPGQHRRFLGRKKSTKPRVRRIGHRPTTPPGGAAISAQSYINMF